MAVVHILLIILKITGILLLVLLGLALLLLMAVLFCPVRYSANAYKTEETYGGDLKITWLLHLISFKALYESDMGEAKYYFRVLGISPEKAGKLYKEIKKKVKPQKTVKDELTAAEQEEKPLVQRQEQSSLAQKKQLQKQKKLTRAEKLWKKLRKLPGKVLNALQNFSLTARKIYGKIRQIKEFLEDDRFLRGKKLILQEIKKLFFHIKPQKMKGYMKFGTEDPCITGEILAAAGIFYPLYGEHFTIEPCFEEKILEGNLWIKGRICGVFFAIMAWKIFMDSDIRYIIKHFKSH